MKILFLILISISVLSCSKDNASQQQTDKSADKPVNLTYSVFFPPTHLQAVAAADFAKEIEKRTNGRVKITVFAGGSLTKAPAVYEGVEQGVSDMGLSCFAYTRGKFPVTAALDLPLGYPNGITATKVADEFVRTFNPKELEGVKVLY
ncbi:MAG TPA: C4-dicarboxylate ABC transporter substrate-binding protein, partial [bacterium]|nr:C4-dicarboxylate ABC transporter substrate-binding protein [bacterium]